MLGFSRQAKPGFYRKAVGYMYPARVHLPWSRHGSGRVFRRWRERQWELKIPIYQVKQRNRGQTLPKRYSFRTQRADLHRANCFDSVYPACTLLDTMRKVFTHTATDGTVTFKVRYKVRGHSRSTTFPTLKDAERFNGMIERWGPQRALEIISGPANEDAPTVRECVEHYIGLRPNRHTREEYSSWARSGIYPDLGDTPINQLTPNGVQHWVNGQDGASATIARNKTLLSSSLGSAVLRGELAANPANGVRIPRQAINTQRAPLDPVYTREECDQIISAMDETYRLLTEFLIESGCRFGEAAALIPADINLDHGRVRINKSYSAHKKSGYTLGLTKSEESKRSIKIDPELLGRLNTEGPYVFTNKSGEMVRDNSYRRTPWRNALVASGLPLHRYGHPHDLRHAHATWLLNAGVALPAIQKRLGHANVMTTLRMYGHPASDSEDQILTALRRR